MSPALLPLITSMLQKKQESAQSAPVAGNDGKASFIQGLLSGGNNGQSQGMAVPPNVSGTGVGKVLGLGAIFGR